MKKMLIIWTLILASTGSAYSQINSDTVSSDVPGGGGSGGGLSQSDIDTPAKLNAFVTPDLADISSSQTFTNKLIDGNGNTIKMLRHATDCTTFTDAVDGQFCFEQDSDNWYVCEPSAGDCDTAGEWKLINANACVTAATASDLACTGCVEDSMLASTFLVSADIDTLAELATLSNFTLSGNTTELGTTSGTLTSGDCVEFDANGNLVAAGDPCGTGGGSALTVEESDANPTVLNVGTIQFNASHFTVTDETGGQVQIDSFLSPLATALAVNPTACDAGQYVTDLDADGTLTCGAVNGANVVFDDTDANFTSSTVSGAIEELFDADVGGLPNHAACKVDYTQLCSVPAFAVPSGTSPTIDSTGDFAINTTSGVTTFWNGSAQAYNALANSSGVATSANNVPTGSSTTIDSTHNIGIDTTGPQLKFYDGSAIRSLPSTQTTCKTIEKIAAADDNMPLLLAGQAITITGVACEYAGSAPTTAATFTLEDGNGNGMTITGTNPTCAAPTANATFAAVTASNTLVAGEMLRFDTTNTPNPDATDTYVICIQYTNDSL